MGCQLTNILSQAEALFEPAPRITREFCGKRGGFLKDALVVDCAVYPLKTKARHLHSDGLKPENIKSTWV